MALLLLVCAAPVMASYLAYFVFKPDARSNYAELIVPPRPVPAELPLHEVAGGAADSATLKGQWLIVVVSAGACDARCEQHLWIQRQLREAAGADSDRIDKLWLVDDGQAPRAETLAAVTRGVPARVLSVARPALEQWLEPARGRTLHDHLYIVDPMGNWMMRAPAEADPARLKRDLQRLLRASASWDRAGR